MRIILIALTIIISLSACKTDIAPYPRPWAYPRIDFPPKEYKEFENNTCPFTFEYPAYGEVVRTNPDSCWVDINFKPFDCKWHITYRHVLTSKKTHNFHFEEYRRLIYNHSKQASRIEESPVKTPAGAGVLFETYGNVGTPAQLFFSDEENIMMMSFYFMTAQKNDSLAPVIDLMKSEFDHVLKTFKWKP